MTKIIKIIIILLLLPMTVVCAAPNNNLQNIEQQSPEFKVFKESIFPKQPAHNPFQAQQRDSSLFITLHYAQAEAIAKIITAKTSGLLSKEGKLEVDPRTNAIRVQDLPSNIVNLKRFIRNVDVPVKQVAIAARIVSINSNSVAELGIKLGTSLQSGVTDGQGMTMDLPARIITPGHFGFNLASLGHGVLLDAELEALQSEGHAKIISRPNLLTLNRQQADIETGEEIPYQEQTSQGNTSVAFKKAVLGLKVTPQIISSRKILLTIAVSQDKVSSLTVNGVPAINTRELHTQVVVGSGQTVVLGGIYEEEREQVVTKVPVLSSIPLVGALFRDRETKFEQKELLIFITPRIVE